MKRVSKIMLLGALLAFSPAVVGLAQQPVSITGVNASLIGDSVVIELQTTRPADFVLDKADGDAWLFLWCDGFVLDTFVGDLPLDFGISGFDGLVEGAALAASGRRSGISITLGPNADSARAFVVNGENSSTLTIPSVSGLSTDKARNHLPDKLRYPSFPGETVVKLESDTQNQLESIPPSPELLQEIGFEIQSVSSRAIEVPVASLEEKAPEVGKSQAFEVAAVAPPEANTLESEATRRFESTPTKLSWDQPGGSSFRMPGMVGPKVASTGPTLEEHPKVTFEEKPKPSFRELARAREEDDPIPSFQGDVAFALSTSTRSGLGQNAEINYQFIPAEATESGSSGGFSGFEEALDKLAEELLKNAGQFNPGPPENSAATNPVSTPTANFYGEYQSPALLSDSGHIDRGLTKDDLSKIRIDMYRILDTPLDEAITLLVDPTDFNVIVDAEVNSNRISLSFKDKQTDLKSALDLITKVYGLQYVVEAGTIVVASKEKMAMGLLAAEPRMFVLSYADPLSVKNILINTGLVPETNVEIYMGESEYPAVNDSTTLSAEDEEGSQEVKLIESNLSSSPRNVLVVVAPAEEMLVIAKVIADLDRKPKLIELEVRVCEVSENAMRDLGIELNENQSTPAPTITLFTETSNENGIIESQSLGSFHRSPLNLLVTLNSLIADGTVEVLAQPTLTTVEGKQAIYFAGERIPYISKVVQSTTGQQIEVDFLNVGITLNFKPRLDKDGKLTIDVNPIVSSLLEFRIIGQLVEAPRTSSRQMATTVRVESGEPFVLAGLITETERTTITKIPFLGDLPLIGKLFRNKNLKGERTEIIVVVTPTVLED